MNFKTRLQVTANDTTPVLTGGNGVDVRYTFDPDEYASGKRRM